MSRSRKSFKSSSGVASINPNYTHPAPELIICVRWSQKLGCGDKMVDLVNRVLIGAVLIAAGCLKRSDAYELRDRGKG